MISNHDKITILHVRCSNYAGGPETTLLGWLRVIDQDRFDSRVLFFEEREGLHDRSVEIFSDNGVPVEMLPWGPSKNVRGAVKKLVAIAREHSNVILHSHDTRSDFVCLIAGRIAKVPVLVSNHAWHAVGVKRWVFEALRGRWLRYADYVVNVSEDTHKETLRRGVPAARSRTIYSGLDLDPYRNPPSLAEAKVRLGFAEDDVVVGNVARMWPEKALHTLVEAAKRLSPKYPKLRIVFVGDGVLEDALRAQVAELGVESHVSFLGFRKDLVEVMAAFDIFALPSSAEGTPMVIYSAMALGKPIVASGVSGVAEILDNEKSALLIGPADTDALTESLDRLLSDPALMQSLGDAARRRMEETYAVDKTIKDFEVLYEQLIAARRTPEPA